MTNPGHAASDSSDLVRALQTWLDGASPQLAALWAKSGEEGHYLNLSQHLADAAAVAGEVYDVWVADATKRHLAAKLGLEKDELQRLVVWFTGSHDAGKATIYFQRLLEKKP